MKRAAFEAVAIEEDGLSLQADLRLPESARGLVIFAHGSGSSRKSGRNVFVANALYDAGLATLLLDLLSNAEEQIDRLNAQFRFDIELLASRLEIAHRWSIQQPRLSHLPVGYFGASTGAAAALIAAAEEGQAIRAVVSRGGRPDLAEAALPAVRAPTLLVVGSLDQACIPLNQKAYQELQCAKRIEIIPGASHLFEESGKLELVAASAAQWFLEHLR